MTRGWIAQRWRIGSASYVSHLLARPWAPNPDDTRLDCPAMAHRQCELRIAPAGEAV